ncbi:MAG: hypothetical protein QM626_01910 [Microbacterium sp.]|uniref:hypothetical protein n=1 Tax=Microbacterium sp. TaxID=51671 RepID=UPI0039E51C7A
MVVFLSILGVLALIGVAATVVAVRTDGYGSVATDWSRVRERDDPGPTRSVEPARPAGEDADAEQGRTRRTLGTDPIC